MNAHHSFEAIKSFSCRACNGNVRSKPPSGVAAVRRDEHVYRALRTVLRVCADLALSNWRNFPKLQMRRLLSCSGACKVNATIVEHAATGHKTYRTFFLGRAESSLLKSRHPKWFSTRTLNQWVMVLAHLAHKVPVIFFLNIVFMSFSYCSCYCLRVHRLRCVTATQPRRPVPRS